MSKYVVIDLEMCKIEQTKRIKNSFSNEIIEIGAVLLDEAFEITDSFKSYVSPEYGRIDSYIKNLTGISEKDTQSAPTANEALKMLADWIPEDAVMVAWSDNDAHQLKNEIKCKGINIPKLTALIDAAVDCQITFGEKMNSPKVYRLSEALLISGIDYDEGAHDALVDAHNTALLFAKMMTEEEFTPSPYYSNKESEELTYNPFADLLKKYKFTG